MKRHELFPYREKNGHWLVLDDASVRGCHCGFKADEVDNGFGDSVIAHLHQTARAEAIQDAAEIVLNGHARQQTPMQLAIKLQQMAMRIRSEGVHQ